MIHSDSRRRNRCRDSDQRDVWTCDWWHVSPFLSKPHWSVKKSPAARPPEKASISEWMRGYWTAKRGCMSLTDGCHHVLAFISSDYPTDFNINCSDCGSNPFFWTSSHFYALFLLQAKADSLTLNSSCLSNIFPSSFQNYSLKVLNQSKSEGLELQT